MFFLLPLAVLLPLLWLIPFVPSGWADRHTVLLRKTVTGLVAALLAASIWASFGALSGRIDSHWTMLHLASFPVLDLSIQIDAITALMLSLVSFVGWQVCQFSIRYLDGDEHQGRYFRWAGFVVASVAGMVLAGSLLWLGMAWVATSLGLHQLLLHYRERPAARRAAWTKFAISRLGDAALFAAVVMVLQHYQTLQFNELFVKAGTLDDSWVDLWIAGLLVVAAMTKSAQFPLHAWLPETMETPTPVSALMHAGVVNAGGYLMLRTSPLMVQSPAAMTGLAIIGGVTAIYAAIVMLTQTSVKKTLAYSTIAQMGFMMLQCGLGAFSAAMVHLLAHSIYKAHAFLASGSVLNDEQAMARVAGPGVEATRPRMPTVVAGLIAFGIAAAALFAAATAWQLDVQTKPGGVLLAGVLGIGLARWLTPMIRRSAPLVIGGGIAATLGLTVLALGMFVAVDACISPALPSLEPSLTPAIVVGGLASGFIGLFLFDLAVSSRAVVAPSTAQSRWARWVDDLHLHASNGFYLSARTRVLLRALRG